MISPRILIVASIISLWFGSPAAASDASDDAIPPPVTSQHRIAIAGHSLRYSAEAGQTAIRDVETGAAHAHIFYVAYRLIDGVDRPTMFVWNGGPGANSAVLHFQTAGPKILRDDLLVDNPATWLRYADLVFVDPVGTGFSRPTSAAFDDEFYGTVGDVASIAEFIRAWRIEHRNEASPLFLAGESWGAGRAASVGYALQKRGLSVRGLLLISGGSGFVSDTPPPLADALHIVDLAATGRFHGKVSPGPSASDAEIDHWARAVYAPALEHPDRLSLAERTAIASDLSRYTGLASGRIDARSLRITPRQYRTGLLADNHQTLNVFDMRRTSDVAEDEGASVITAYLRNELGYLTAAPYVGLEPVTDGYAPSGTYPTDVGDRWDYATGKVSSAERDAAMAAAVANGSGPPKLGPPLPATRELVALDPAIRILVATGRYDSLNSCADNAETGAHLSGALGRAVTFKCYAGGHMMYRDAAARAELSRDVANLVGR